MKQKEYKFNPKTLTYEPIYPATRLRVFRFVRKLLIFFIVACCFNLAFSYNYYTPKIEYLEKENQKTIKKYTILSDKIAITTSKLDELKQRDNSVYRSLFGVDTLNIEGIYTPYSNRSYAFANLFSHDDLIIKTWKELDQATRLLYRESKSLDELQVLSKDKEKMAGAIPAIWPIDKRDFSGSMDPFGRRFHPIKHRYIHHDGMDFGGRTGNPIYTTGNGVISRVSQGERRSGYGRLITINHGFGYETRYAHLSKMHVIVGQEVKRGEVIGDMGSTGGSTGPHLHYEVRYMGRPVDPLNYFRRDMDEDEFERIIESAKTTTFETLEETTEEIID